MAVLFVANNLVHESTHAFEKNLGAQSECGSCHVFNGILVFSASDLPAASFFIDRLFEEPLLGSSPSPFSLYLSRAPPKVYI
jgi:hypothetical protein